MRGSLLRDIAPFAAAALVAVIAALTASTYVLQVAASAALFGAYAVSWSTYCYPSGESSFGHSLFIGAGAYAAGLMTVRAGMPPLVALVGGAVLAALLGFLISLTCVRLRGAYFVMVTMAAQVMFSRSLYLFSGVFGGGEGVVGIPPVIRSPLGSAALTVALCVAIALIASMVSRSRIARVVAAASTDEPLALASGLRVRTSRLLLFASSAGLAGLAGAGHAMYVGQVTAELGGEWLSAVIVMLGLLGRPGGLAGVVLAALSYVVIQQLFVSLSGFDAPLLSAVFLVAIYLTRFRRRPLELTAGT